VKFCVRKQVFTEFRNETDTGVPQNVFCYPNAVWASASGAFRIVSDRLFILRLCRPIICLPRWRSRCVVVRAAWLRWSASLGSRSRLAGSLCQVIAAYALRLNSRAGTEDSTVSSLICDRWLILGLETLSISRCLNHWLHYITLHYITVFSARPTTTRVGLAVQMSTMLKTRSVKIKSR